MNNVEKCITNRRHKINIGIVAVLFILAGLAIFAHKQGYLDSYIYDIVVSWQMLVVILGVWSIICREYWNGALLVGIGAFFLIPVVIGAGPGWVKAYWPLLLVLVGVLIILSLFRRRGGGARPEQRFAEHTSYNTEEGFVVSDNRFGSVNHIVLDPVFKGATIQNSFGSTILDLRHTTLEGEETYIDLDCRFGAVELLVPHGWTVVSNIQAALAGVDDKRFRHDREPGQTRKLILRGRITFGGVEIKN